MLDGKIASLVFVEDEVFVRTPDDLPVPYNGLLDLWFENADAVRALEFRLAQMKQLYWGGQLLDKNHKETLSDRERGELSMFEQLEHVVRLLKVGVLAKTNRWRLDPSVFHRFPSGLVDQRWQAVSIVTHRVRLTACWCSETLWK